jgi:hypothetical protein
MSTTPPGETDDREQRKERPGPRPVGERGDQIAGGTAAEAETSNQRAWKVYDSYTGLASENARKLGFAAGGLMWLLREPGGTWAPIMLVAALMLVGYFVFDLLQYVAASARLRHWLREREHKLDRTGERATGDYTRPRNFDNPIYSMWKVKVGLLCACYAMIVVHVAIWNLCPAS